MNFDEEKLIDLPLMMLNGYRVSRYRYDDMNICVSEEKENNRLYRLVSVCVSNPETVVKIPDTKLLECLLGHFGIDTKAPLRCFSGPKQRERSRTSTLYFMQEKSA